MTYLQGTSGAAAIIKGCNDDISWSWLKEAPTLLVPMRDAAEELDKCLTHNDKRFLQSGPKEIKAAMDAPSFLAMLRALMVKLDSPLKKLDAQVNFLQSTHDMRRGIV